MNSVANSGPCISSEVVLHAPYGDEDSWILQVGSRRYIRIHPDMTHLIEYLDGRHSSDSIAEALGGSWTQLKVETAIEKLSSMKLLDTKQEKLHEKRIHFFGLHRIQFTLLNTPRLFEQLRPIVRLVVSKPSQLLSFSVIIAGIIALIINRTVVFEAISTPVSFATYFGVGFASLLIMFLHEFAHGMVLTGLGGTPNRIGAMLFYFTPAFFCDVTDAWRLPKRIHRVAIAFGGILFQLFIAGITSIISLVSASETFAKGFVIFTVVNYVSCFINALPFIKLDGHLALMTALDKPFLRERSIEHARHWLSRILFGGLNDIDEVDIRTIILSLFSMIMHPISLHLWSLLFLRASRGLG